MRILIAHNFYQQPGGEDGVFFAESQLLESFAPGAHEVAKFVMHNDQVEAMGRLALARATVWNRAAAEQFGKVVREHRPDVVHFHNTFPLISPASYSAAREHGAAVVQTLHNFRIICPSAVFYRDGKVCEDCLTKKLAWPGVAHACYRDNRAASAVIALTSATHRALGTYRNAVDLYIAPSPSAKAKFVESGALGEDQIVVKPHFVDPDPGVGEGAGDYAVFVGRLSYEKGLDTLLAAWEVLGERIPLKIIGDGPLADQVTRAVQNNPAIHWLGRRAMDDVNRIVGDAKVLVLPSSCYETFGRVAIEAFARGTPVIASNHGAMADVVSHERTGLLFAPGDARDLSVKVLRACGDDTLLARLRADARREYVAHYTAAENYRQLIGVYERAIAITRSRRPAGRQPIGASSQVATP
jgi:glycosyltransferase involved in cell wall biosynthesis